MTTDDLERELRTLHPEPLAPEARVRIRAALAGQTVRQPRSARAWVLVASITLIISGTAMAISVLFRPPIPIGATLAATNNSTSLTMAQLRRYNGDLEQLTNLLDAHPWHMTRTVTASPPSFTEDLP